MSSYLAVQCMMPSCSLAVAGTQAQVGRQSKMKGWADRRPCFHGSIVTSCCNVDCPFAHSRETCWPVRTIHHILHAPGGCALLPSQANDRSCRFPICKPGHGGRRSAALQPEHAMPLALDSSPLTAAHNLPLLHASPSETSEARVVGNAQLSARRRRRGGNYAQLSRAKFSRDRARIGGAPRIARQAVSRKPPSPPPLLGLTANPLSTNPPIDPADHRINWPLGTPIEHMATSEQQEEEEEEEGVQLRIGRKAVEIWCFCSHLQKPSLHAVSH